MTTDLDATAWSAIAAQYVHVATGRVMKCTPHDVSEALGNLFGDLFPDETSNVSGDFAFLSFMEAAELGFRVAVITLAVPARDALPQISELIAKTKSTLEAGIKYAVPA